MEKQESDRSTTSKQAQEGGGIPKPSDISHESRRPSTGHDAQIAVTQKQELEEPAGVQLLREIGVRRAVREKLAARPHEQVAQVIAQARARGDVRDLAGWVVSALRELPEAQPAGPPQPKASDRTILVHPELTHAERSRWLTRFRNADAIERLAVLERFNKEHPHEQFV